MTSTRRSSTRVRQPPSHPTGDLPLSYREEKLLRLALIKSQSDVLRADNLRVAIPEAPVFYPTAREFEDPMRYINSILPIVLPFGIGKIVPPKSEWECPFALNAAGGAATKSQEQSSLGLESKSQQQPQELSSLGLQTKPQQQPQEDSSLRSQTKPLEEHSTYSVLETKRQAIHRLGEGVPYEEGRTFGSVEAYRREADRVRLEWEEKLGDVEEEEWERMYWRIVDGAGDEVVVEYGNDVPVEVFGSGFPGVVVPCCSSNVTQTKGQSDEKKTSSSKNNEKRPSHPNLDLYPPSPSKEEYEKYAKSPWNLNNLPHAPGSVLRHLHDRINGINVPWMYFGMTFSTFSWHVEDNWLFSINYSHGGATKTWYGVPPEDREKFDAALKAIMPQRFDDEPELLSQITTMMSPMYLTARGVRVCRLDQRPGEFVFTLPAAYHAGFSHGFNVGEAVNFALPSWIRPGRLCRAKYRELKRRPVIAHDKIVWQLSEPGALHRDWLDQDDLVLLREELQIMCNDEERLREQLMRDGITFQARMPPEPPNSDEPDIRRRCCACRQPASLSAVICRCSPAKTACPLHHAHLCKCEPVKKCMVFWSTVEELREKIAGVEEALEKKKKQPT